MVKYKTIGDIFPERQSNWLKMFIWSFYIHVISMLVNRWSVIKYIVRLVISKKVQWSLWRYFVYNTKSYWFCKKCSNALISFAANSRLRYKAQNMIGATGSRHLSQRRRASLATPAASPSMFSHLEQVNEEDENKPRLPPTRRRAVDTSDYRTCAILQTRLKTVRNYPE